MYKNVKKKIEKGIAFPTCLSVNNTVCHFSPLASDEAVLEEGDVLKMWVFLNRLFCPDCLPTPSMLCLVFFLE